MDNNANALGDGGGDHARAASSFFTASHPKKTGGSDIHVGISIDQADCASRLVPKRACLLWNWGLTIAAWWDIAIPVIVALTPTASLGVRAYDTVYRPKRIPVAIFERLFGDIDTSVDAGHARPP